jgi:hypothetical protein
MKKLASSIIGGIAGAVALNILHQAVKQFDHEAPRVDLIGEEAITKRFRKRRYCGTNRQHLICRNYGR